MGLKQDIVVVSEFSVKTPSGGTRGGTPGQYVERYMARGDAVEDLTPVRLDDPDLYVTRYMARKDATEKYDSVGRIKAGMRDAQKLGGIAFGSSGKYDDGDVSMSHRKVKRVSKDIQKQFEAGKTVMKTVLSFDLSYLKRMGIVEPDFEPQRRGDYRGNVDQLKLRLAIIDGMKKMGKRFDDLEWVGVIQVDTMHVHCHLCMVDKGQGRQMGNGEQKGKLDETDKRTLRRSIDMNLDEMSPVKMLASNVAYDRRNARCFIKKFTHAVMERNGTSQLLLACLPDDKNVWRAGTHRREMKKANAIVREYVEAVLAQPDSGYKEALREIESYALTRQSREGLKGAEFRKLISQGRERLITDCMNGVYAVLSTIPSYEKNVTTPMLDVMSMEYTEMAEATSDPMIEFGFKLRSYSSRLQHHKKEKHKYKDAMREFEEAEAAGNVAPDAHVLYDFYKFEEEYNAELMAKYQHFLAFLPPTEEYESDFETLMSERDKLVKLKQMMADKGMKRRGAESAEDYGLKVYDTAGGHWMVDNPRRLEQRRDAFESLYETHVGEFKDKLADMGMSMIEDGEKQVVRTTPPYEFDDVKALDLHHLGYDFPYDAPISKPNVDAFVAKAHEREMKLNAAVKYLRSSRQGFIVSQLPVQDVTSMVEYADMLSRGNKVIESKKAGNGGKGKKRDTVSLDMSFDEDMKQAIRAVINSVEFNE